MRRPGENPCAGQIARQRARERLLRPEGGCDFVMLQLFPFSIPDLNFAAARAKLAPG
jgi:hypothetical protein